MSSKESSLKTIKGVFYDFDGTLAQASIKAVVVPNYAQILDLLGIAFTFEDYRLVAGLSTLETLRVMIDRRATSRIQANTLLDAIRLVKGGYSKRLQLAPNLIPFGTMGALNGLKNTRVKLGIATLAPAELVLRRLIEWGYGGFFDFIVGGGNGIRPKPAPDVYLAVAAELQLSPATCVGIEDTPAGIQSLRSAGMRAIGVRTAVPDKDLKAAGAHEIVDDVRNVTLEYLEKFERSFPSSTPP